MIQGIEWAVDQGVDILNISWGTDRDDERLHHAVKSASDKGILIIAGREMGKRYSILLARRRQFEPCFVLR